MATAIYIKNMVCNRCIMVVHDELAKLGLKPKRVELGVATFNNELKEIDIELIKNRLEAVGFELIDDKRVRLVEKIKNVIIELVHHSDNKLKVNLSEYISDRLHYEYTYLSNTFSEIENTTIEQYYIAQRVERIKELLVYDELTLTEIADQMGYSSSAYLSSQFKKVTGFTPSYFKRLKEHKRKPIDKV